MCDSLRRAHGVGLRLVLGLCVAATASMHAQQAAQLRVLPRSVTVWFKGPQVGESYGLVMAALSRATPPLIDLQAYPNSAGSPILRVLVDTGRLVGATIPEPFERYLCDVNVHICSASTSQARGAARFRWRIAKSDRSSASPGDGLCPADRNTPPDLLCLPSIEVTTSPSSLVLDHYDSQKDDLRRVVLVNGACKSLDETCLSWTKGLNARRDLPRTFPAGYKGELTVPATEYRLTLEIKSSTQLQSIAPALDAVVAQMQAKYKWPSDQRFLFYSVNRAAALQGEFVEMDSDTAKMPLDRMHHPYPDRQQFAKTSDRLRTDLIGVWDGHVDDDHCGYLEGTDKAIKFLDALPVGPNDKPRFSRAVCGSTRAPETLSQKWDHGTHVAGIIAARYGAWAMFGGNPKAKIWAYEIGDGTRLGVDGDPFDRLARQDPLVTPDVVNISAAEPVGAVRSTLETIVRAHVKNRDSLFVAAAGNVEVTGDENKDEAAAQILAQSDCRLIPACLSADKDAGAGVISVVALDPGGTKRLKTKELISHYGPVFDVAAIGLALSTIDGNAFQAMAGTSVAAPYVTALASLIFAQTPSKRGLLPSDVKDRILYTGDFSETLDALAKFGLINFGRALDLSTDILEQEATLACPAPCLVKGTLSLKTTEHLTISRGRRDDGTEFTAPLTIDASQLRRIVRADPTTYYVVYKEGLALRKITEAVLDDSATKLRFQLDVAGSQPEEIKKISSYADFVAAIRR